MQKDFHYYCIAVLARSAGFEPEDALTIAYASQYVDDAKDRAPLTINQENFVPVLTAHMGLESMQEDTWREVYVSFHFLPPGPSPAVPAGLITEANSPMARALVDAAMEQNGPLERLVSLGVALHTYADTWAHQGFCGWNCGLNRVREIQVRHNGGFEPVPLQELNPARLLEIGHMQAGSLPDRPYRVWRYRAGPRGEESLVFRDNPSEFIKAARALYAKLLQASPQAGRAPTWQDLAGQVELALSFASDDEDERCRRWQTIFNQRFAHVDWEYDSMAWRREAIEEDDSLGFEENTSPPPEPVYLWRGDRNERPWAAFHRAAQRQRDWVRDRVFA
ncbi:MAG: hypothetical protein KJ921_17290 [Proteobacteria bacterium]|nr:hypothetical protein [Pseudomonadota bacterium]